MYNCSLFDRFGCAEQLYVMATPDEIKIAVLKSDILTLENGAVKFNNSTPKQIVGLTVIPPPPPLMPPLTLMSFWHWKSANVILFDEELKKRTLKSQIEF